FFFSSRRRHTRFDCDWSSDVCSSDLTPLGFCAGERPIRPAPLPAARSADPLIEELYGVAPGTFPGTYDDWLALVHPEDRDRADRSEERRVGKECSTRWGADR